jgi:hypothetical protein
MSQITSQKFEATRDSGLFLHFYLISWLPTADTLRNFFANGSNGSCFQQLR